MDIKKQKYLKQTTCETYQYSIIIPTFNSKESLLLLLDSIIASKDRQRFEIIVVDDASTDQTCQAIANYPVRLIVSDKNRGSAHARNTGAFSAQTPYLIFFDADVVLQSNTLDLLIKSIKDQPKNHVYMGIYSAIPAKKNLISEYKALLDANHWKKIKSLQVTSFEPRCAIMRKSLFDQSGGFDDRISGADVEDYELGYRLLDLNARLFVNPSIRVNHHFPMSFKQLLLTMFCRTKSWMQLFLKRKKFDNVASTPESALACGISGLSGLLIPAVGFHNDVRVGFFCLICLFIFLFSDFIIHIFRTKGWWTGSKMFVLHYMICICVFWGAMAGLFNIIMTKDVIKSVISMDCH
jgi:GT2 family glycosyltransferase